MATSGIYKIINKVNGKFYVGRSKNIKRRFKRHIRDLDNNRHHSIYLQRAWIKYGKENFELIIIEEIENKEEMIQREQYYIDNFKDELYNSGDLATDGGDLISNHPNKDEIINKMKNSLVDRYNSLTEDERKEIYGSPGELNGMYGRNHSEESRKKMSNVLKEIYKTQEVVNKGKKLEEIITTERAKEVREHLSKLASERTGEKNHFYGKRHSEESRKKMSESRRGKKQPKQYKPVMINGKEYESLTSAAKACNITIGAMHNRIKSKNPLYSGYFYKEDLETNQGETS